MKTYLAFLFILTGSFSLTARNFPNDLTGPYSNYIDLVVDDKEDWLDLHDYLKEPKEIQTEYDLFKNNLIYLGKERKYCAITRWLFLGITREHNHFENTPTEIRMEQLVDLYTKMHEDLKQQHIDYNVSAIKIEFGFENNQLVPYFRLLTLKKDSTAPKKYDKTKYVPTEYGPRYRYNVTTGFVEVTDCNPAPLKDYLENVCINHCILKYPNCWRMAKKIWFHDPKQIGDIRWKSDSKAIIFSFQELFILYKGSFKDAEDGALKYTHNIYLYNGMARFHKYPRKGTLNRNKHTMFFATQNAMGAGSSQSFAAGTRAASSQVDDKAANLAHLSPPNSEELYYSTH